MFSTIGLIIIAIITGGSLIALFGFFGPLSRDILAVLPFIVFVGCVSFVLLIAGNALKLILSIPGKNRNEGQAERVEYVEIRRVNGGTSKISDGTQSRRVVDGKRKRKQVIR
jgi:hypothetical protein